MNEFGHKWELNPGDGAFYGPKVLTICITIDFKNTKPMSTNAHVYPILMHLIGLYSNANFSFKNEYQGKVFSQRSKLFSAVSWMKRDIRPFSLT